jgi:hypothetical protein
MKGYQSLLIGVSVALLSISGNAQLTPANGIDFKLGDDVQTVKNALKTDIDPEPLENSIPNASFNFNAGKSSLFLRTKGIHVNFNRKNVVESIMFEAPFAGAVAGVRLGDSDKKVTGMKGKPIKTPYQFGASQVYLYALDDSAYIRFDISEAEGVKSIWIQK